MARAAGILTSRGGLASHAAVVARGWGIPAVVGAGDLEVRDGEVNVGDRVLRAGDLITIDGGTGEVFEGAVAGTTEVVPRRRRSSPGRRSSAYRSPPMTSRRRARPRHPRRRGLVSRDACLRAIGIKGFAQPQGVADVVLAKPEDVQPILDALVADGLVAPSAGALRLTDAGSTSRRRAPRRGAGRLGSRQRRGRARRVPRARPANEGHRHRLADARRRPPASSTTTPTSTTTMPSSSG